MPDSISVRVVGSNGSLRQCHGLNFNIKVSVTIEWSSGMSSCAKFFIEHASAVRSAFMFFGRAFREFASRPVQRGTASHAGKLPAANGS
mmetsp:Transcript_130462/g.418321  ORF Transcript_130462/g.418321 Transcript_130462/m.418321 type:complete len:89 (-) Transcript_130462:114-380(-)